MVVLARLVPFRVSVTEGPKSLPLIVLTSKPVGAVRVMLAVKLLPLTVKLCGMEAEPLQAEKAVSEVVLRVMVGPGIDS